jgi:hypothetical protein
VPSGDSKFMLTPLALSSLLWSPRTYERYLDHMRNWAVALSIADEQLECCVFEAEARLVGSQWAPTSTSSRPSAYR